MKTRLLIGISLSAILSSNAFALTDYRTIDRTKVPDGAFDYPAFDSPAHLVFIARGDFTKMIAAKRALSPVL